MGVAQVASVQHCRGCVAYPQAGWLLNDFYAVVVFVLNSFLCFCKASHCLLSAETCILNYRM